MMLPVHAMITTVSRAWNHAAVLPWLDEYAIFHASHRHRGPWLIYTCTEADVELGLVGHEKGCSGFGDRLRFIAFLLRVAAVFKRVLLVHWVSPAPLEHALRPTRVLNWSMVPEAHEAILHTEGPPLAWNFRGFHEPLKYSPPNDKAVRAIGNQHWNFSINVPGYHDLRANSFHDLWSVLFRPAPRLTTLLRQRRRELFGSETSEYDAMHFRMGDGAKGSAFAVSTVPGKMQYDVRMSLPFAKATMGCARQRTPSGIQLYTKSCTRWGT